MKLPLDDRYTQSVGDSKDKIMLIQDPLLTLQVQFYGEVSFVN